MNAEDRASFCPCCGTSFITQPIVPPAPSAPPAKAKPQPVAPPPLPFEDKKKKGGHALPIVIISILTILAVGLSALWLTGGLAAILNKDKAPQADQADSPVYTTTQTMPTIAATYDGGEITTQQYLAYLYLEFENLYFNQGLYQQETFGQNPWEQEFPYGEESDKLLLSDYIIRATQDNIKRQIVLQQMMEDYGLQWFAEDEAEINKTLAAMEKDAYLDLGFNNNAYGYALKNCNLNERSTFYGLYKAGGVRAVSELTLRQHFVQNYLSFKLISIPLTDSNNKPLDKDGEAYEQIMTKMSDYLTVYEQSGFNAVYALHTGAPAENARQDEDATTMDPALAQAVRTVQVGDATLVEYMAGGTTPTIALIERLDIYDTNELFEESVENILYTLQYEAFNAEVKEAMKRLNITFDKKVVAEGKPEEMLEILMSK